MEGDVIGDGKFQIGEKIADGSFSRIYKGVVLESSEEVAIKVEPIETVDSPLANEYVMYQRLHEKVEEEDEVLYKDASVGIPTCIWYGEDSKYRFLVIQLLGSSLEDLVNDLLKVHGDEAYFSLKTVLMIADQIIDTISYMHDKCVIHRDIRPEHLLMGLGSNANKVYLIDFGRAKFYIDSASNEHIPYRENLPFTGSYRYASLNAHFGVEQSRRDDAVSFCYVLMYLLNACLPWQGLIEGDDKEKHSLVVCNRKFRYTRDEELAKLYPPEIAECLDYTRVNFNDTPFLLGMKITLRKLFIRKGYQYDFVYDWTKAPKKEDDTKMEISSEKPKRSLDARDSSSDMISDDVSSSEDVSNDPNKHQRIN